MLRCLLFLFFFLYWKSRRSSKAPQKNKMSSHLFIRITKLWLFTLLFCLRLVLASPDALWNLKSMAKVTMKDGDDGEEEEESVDQKKIRK